MFPQQLHCLSSFYPYDFLYPFIRTIVTIPLPIVVYKDLHKHFIAIIMYSLLMVFLATTSKNKYLQPTLFVCELLFLYMVSPWRMFLGYLSSMLYLCYHLRFTPICPPVKGLQLTLHYSIACIRTTAFLS